MLDDLTNLQALLKDSTLLATKGYIAGQWCDGENGKTFPVYNPARGDVITDVADISRTQATKAISISEKAQKLWAARPAKERSNLLRKWYNLMMENQEDLATILTAEQGKPIDEAKGEIAYGASFIEKHVCINQKSNPPDYISALVFSKFNKYIDDIKKIFSNSSNNQFKL